MRDAARTSPPSHVVVEKVLYGFVCLSVPLKIFTRRRRRPAICSNIPYLLFYYPLTSLTDSYFLLLLSRVDSGSHFYGQILSQTDFDFWTTFFVLVCDWTETITHHVREDN